MKSLRIATGTASVPYGCVGVCEGKGCGQGACDFLSRHAVASLLNVSRAEVNCWCLQRVPSTPKPEPNGFFRIDALARWLKERGKAYFGATKGRGWYAAMTVRERTEYKRLVDGNWMPEERRAASRRALANPAMMDPANRAKGLAVCHSRPLPESQRIAIGIGQREYQADPAARSLIDERNARAQQTRLANPNYVNKFIGASKRPEIRAKISATLRANAARRKDATKDR